MEREEKGVGRGRMTDAVVIVTSPDGTGPEIASSPMIAVRKQSPPNVDI
jgi:hypothetical protein